MTQNTNVIITNARLFRQIKTATFHILAPNIGFVVALCGYTATLFDTKIREFPVPDAECCPDCKETFLKALFV